jgi:putative DNA methylase
VANIEADVAERARQLAYRLYSICERKGWAELGFWYNALVSSWLHIVVRAAQEREEQKQGKLI